MRSNVSEFGRFIVSGQWSWSVVSGQLLVASHTINDCSLAIDH